MKSLALSILLVAFAAFLPLTASASFVTWNEGSYPNPLATFHGNGNPNVQALLQDALTYGAACKTSQGVSGSCYYNSASSYAMDLTNGFNNNWFGGGYIDGLYAGEGAQDNPTALCGRGYANNTVLRSTVDRVCQIQNAVYANWAGVPADPGVAMSSCGAGDYDGTGQNNTIAFGLIPNSGVSSWDIMSADKGGYNFISNEKPDNYVTSLTCSTGSVPYQQISVTPDHIQQGQSANLSWVDNDIYGDTAGQTCTLTNDQSSDPGNATAILPAALPEPSPSYCTGLLSQLEGKATDPGQTSPDMDPSLARGDDTFLNGEYNGQPRYEFFCAAAGGGSNNAQQGGGPSSGSGGGADAQQGGGGGGGGCGNDPWDGPVPANCTLSHQCNQNLNEDTDTFSCAAAPFATSTSVMPAETTTYSYTCTNVNGSYTAHATLTVTGANGPNLTAGTVSPQTADPGTPQNFTGTVTNIGNAPTGTGFNDLWQRADSWDGTTATNVQNLGVVAMNALDASGGTHDHDTATLSEYSFPSSDAGTTRYLRLCADEDASGNGTITETNETDNCGGWTPVNVSGSQESPSVSCTPNPTDVQVGDTVVWTPSAAGFTGTPSYSWTTVGGGSPSSGNGSTFSDSYSAAGNYTVNVVATAGSQTANNSCTPAVTVEPTGGGGPPTATITASPLRLASGLTTDLEWTATNIATSCTVTGTDGYTKTDTPDPNGNVADGDPAHLITGQTKFTVSCDSGAATASVIVNVLPGFQEF